MEENRPRTYCAVIADVVQSRSLPDRVGFQRRLLALVEGADTLLPPGEVTSRFVVTAGDELQGLLRTPAPAYDLLVALENTLGPSRFRMGVGFGSLTTDLKPVCLGMDGPAFHRARAALQECRQTGHRLAYRLGDLETDELLTSYAALLERIRLSWTPRQQAQIRLYTTLGDQSSVADALGISKAAVTKAFKSARLRSYQKARLDLARYLGRPDAPWARGTRTEVSP